MISKISTNPTPGISWKCSENTARSRPGRAWRRNTTSTAPIRTIRRPRQWKNTRGSWKAIPDREAYDFEQRWWMRCAYPPYEFFRRPGLDPGSSAFVTARSHWAPDQVRGDMIRGFIAQPRLL